MGETDKIYQYQNLIGRGNLLRQEIRDYYHQWREQHPHGFVGALKEAVGKKKNGTHSESFPEQYQHIFRKKTRWELLRISAAITGIELSYAAETAYVSPTLLKIGVEHKRMTLVWALSPLVGLFLSPILGSLSDSCTLSLGRRRPFIILMGVGVTLGLLLVPNGEYLGYMLGDPIPEDVGNFSKESSIMAQSKLISNSNSTPHNYTNSHPWGIFLTILGTVLLDFNADGCQSPARAYLLDITVPEDHTRGLSTFTIMAGLGGFFGYALGGIDWDITYLGELLGGHVRAVFTFITVTFLACITYTVTSFREIPLRILEETKKNYFALNTVPNDNIDYIKQNIPQESTNMHTKLQPSYGTSMEIDVENYKSDDENIAHDYTNIETANGTNQGKEFTETVDPNLSAMFYLRSIVFMPHSLRMLCLTNLFCWMAHVCYSLYFTDFVGEAVFKGDPTGMLGTRSRDFYEEGVRFGCWGMSMYSLSCASYSLIIEKLIVRFRARRVYVYGILVYSTGMFLMALIRNKFAVIVFSGTAGVMYSTLFTMPYMLVSQYHETGIFEKTELNEPAQIRGLGTDIALVSSMVFLAQFILSMCMGTIVTWSGTTTAVVSVACVLSVFGSISASQVMYLDE